MEKCNLHKNSNIVEHSRPRFFFFFFLFSPSPPNLGWTYGDASLFEDPISSPQMLRENAF